MNVTIEINDELAKRARHEAVDGGLSLSGWVAELIREKLTRKGANKSLLEALGCDEISELDMEFPRSKSAAREIHFP